MSTTNYTRLLRTSSIQHPDYRKDMFGDRLPTPSSQTLDKIAEEKITGGYNTKRSNMCMICYTYKSTSGSCNC